MAAVLTVPVPPGAIAVVRVPRLGDFGAVRTPSGKWAIKADDGLSVAAFQPLAVWRVDGGDVTAFLRMAAGARFRFGDWDCALMLANWVRAATGDDPAPHLRGRYHTALGWKRIVNRAGGLVPLVDGLARAAGLDALALAG